MLYFTFTDDKGLDWQAVAICASASAHTPGTTQQHTASYSNTRHRSARRVRARSVLLPASATAVPRQARAARLVGLDGTVRARGLDARWRRCGGVQRKTRMA